MPLPLSIKMLSPLKLALAVLLGVSAAFPQQTTAQTRGDERTVTVEPDGCSAPAAPDTNTSCPPGAMEEAVEAMYDDLPRSEITTGLLYDRVLQAGDVRKHDGSSNTPPSDTRTWKTMYEGLYEAAYETRGMEAPSDLEAAAELAPEGVIPILVAYVEFDKIDYEAYNDYRLDFDDVNDKFTRDVNNDSPYDQHTFFAAAPAVSHTYGTSVTFEVDQDYYTTNTNQTPSYFRIDFGDGAGFRRVDWGEQVTAQYGGTGTKEVHLKAIYGSVTHEARFELRVAPPHTDLDYDPAITDKNKTAPYEGEEVDYEYYGIYGQGNTSIEKPIVVLDGIDFGDVIDLDDGPRTFEEIVDRFNEKVTLDDGTTHRTLTELHNDGFDIFVLNYKDGADHIRRNAFALVDLLENVISQRTGGRKQITVIGPSMGGVVSRYALSYMEHEGIEHNVGLFISYDSPQQGANVPVGLQHMLESFPKILQSRVANRLAMLSRPAAKELTKYYVLDGPDGVHSFRQQMLNDLEAYGDYPDHYRLTKVAVANGSGDGDWQKGNNGQTLGTHENIFKLTGGTNSNWGYEYEADVYSAPNRTERVVYQSDHYITQGLWLLELRIKVPGAGVDRKANIPPYDSAPGGRRAFTGPAEDEAPDDGIVLGLHLFDLPFVGAETDYDYQSFIPTVSALDYNTCYPQSCSPDEQDYFYDVMNDSESEQLARTPFDDILASEKNTKHATVTADIYEFLLGHIYHVPENWQLADKTFDDPEPPFKAQHTIAVENSTVKSGADVTMQAGESITLEAGFKVEKGATFSANVDPGLTTPDTPPSSISTGPTTVAAASETPSSTESSKKAADNIRHAAAKRAGAHIDKGIPDEYALHVAAPNPVRTQTTLRYALPEAADVRLVVYNVMGRRVATLSNGRKAAGHYRLSLRTSDYPSGVYLYRLTAQGKDGDFQKTRQLVVAR